VAFAALLAIFAGNERADITFAGAVASYALLAVALDLVWGYAGILSIGHALYFGAGAYVTALGVTRHGIADLAVLAIAGMLTATVLAAVVGALVLYGKRAMPLIFVAMTTLATSFVAQSLASSTPALGSDTGLPNARPATVAGLDLERGRPLLYLTLVVVVAVVLGLRRLLSSDLGAVVTGLRESEDLLHDTGFSVGPLKVFLFALSGAVAGLAGVLYTANVGYVSPGVLGFELSTMAVVWVLAGGAGFLVGAMYGVMLVEYVTRYLSSAWVGWRDVILGTSLMLVVLVFRSGVYGIAVGLADRIAQRTRPEGVDQRSAA
jgi:ABC-type branched-subunit amino acid transport system permease subunit